MTKPTLVPEKYLGFRADFLTIQKAFPKENAKYIDIHHFFTEFLRKLGDMSRENVFAWPENNNLREAFYDLQDHIDYYINANYQFIGLDQDRRTLHQTGATFELIYVAGDSTVPAEATILIQQGREEVQFVTSKDYNDHFNLECYINGVKSCNEIDPLYQLISK